MSTTTRTRRIGPARRIRAIVAALAVATVVTSGAITAGVITPPTASAETPAERCARETTAYNNAWAQSWAATNGKPASQAPPPPVPYVCTDPNQQPTTSTPTTTEQPGIPTPTNTNPGTGPNIGVHGATDIPEPGERPIVDSSGDAQGSSRHDESHPHVDYKPKPTTPTTKTPTITPKPRDIDPGTDSENESPKNDLSKNELIQHVVEMNRQFQPACSDAEASRPGHYWTDIVYKRAMEYWDRHGIRGASELNSRVWGDVMLANNNSVADCHNSRSTSTADCAAGDTSTRCQGPVAVCAPKTGPPESAAERSQREQYVEKAWGIAQGSGGLVKTKLTEEQKRVASINADNERRREERKPGNSKESNIYAGKAVGHAPDRTWGPLLASPKGYVAMDSRVNSSIAGQSHRYPYGYRATSFRMGEWQPDGRCGLALQNQQEIIPGTPGQLPNLPTNYPMV